MEEEKRCSDAQKADGEETSPEQQIIRQLQEMNQLYNEMSYIYHCRAMRSGLSDTAFWVLLAVCEADRPHTQNELCKELFYPKQTLNSTVSSLVKKGYLCLKPIPGTRNSKAVCLTEEGSRYCEKHMMELVQADRKSFARLSGEERRQFLNLMKKQVTYFKEELE